MPNDKDIEEARKIFFDIKEFFGSDEKLEYFLTVIGRQDTLNVLDDIRDCLIKAEDYERCEEVKTWKTRIEECKDFK